jgi:hypothetical protein
MATISENVKPMPFASACSCGINKKLASQRQRPQLHAAASFFSLR